MKLRLKLNARFQPMHRFELEDALQEILVKEGLGEITGGGTAQNPDGEIAYCDIDIYLNGDKEDDVTRLADLLNGLGIPKGSLLLGIESEIKVGTLEGLACYCKGTDLPADV